MDKDTKLVRLQKLQDKYISQLPDKLNALEMMWKEAIHDRDISALPALRRQLHNLAGSAGTFGYSAVSIEARNLEELLRSTTTVDALTSDDEMKISDALQRMVCLIDNDPDEKYENIVYANDETAAVTEFDRLIYVLEGDELLAKDILTQLHYYDYEVEIFSTVKQSMEAIKLRVPSAMIIDIQLSEGELVGPGFALLFNELSEKNVPSIIISSRDDWQTRLSAVRANASSYLTKPIDFNDLLERIDLLTMVQTPDPYRVLIIDDMVVLAEHYAAVLAGADMKVEVVSDINNLLEVLSGFKPELILMDVHMPQCSGLEVARIIRQKDEFLSVPIVFLSTEADPLKHLTAMELGGDDFLQKPIKDEQLVVAVRSRAQRFRNLRSHMHCDGLTGLLNHVTIKNQLITEISRAHRQQHPLTFAMIDLDTFKDINDTYGHPVGDRVIKSVARMLVKRLRKTDIIGRYGGEEFAVILPETSLNMAKSILDAIRQSFSQTIQQSNAGQFTTTFSVGIARLEAHSSINTIIDAADKALYEAKSSGRNNIQVS